MRRSAVGLLEVATLENLARAFYLAARGKRARPAVRAFERNLWRELSRLSDDILQETVPVGRFTSFRINDPKPRDIRAPVFRERVLHHAVMRHVGPVLDRGLIDDTYACRVGKGPLAAVERAREHARRHPWYVQIDIRRYFDSIDHELLKAFLRRFFKAPGLLHLMDRMIGTVGRRAEACR